MEIVPISCALNVNKIQHKMMLLWEEMLGYSPPAISPELFFSGLLKYPETQEIFIAIDRTTSDILGICSVVQEQSVFKKQLLITELFVTRRMRRHKVGTHLLSKAKHYAKTHACERILVTISRKFPDSRGLYSGEVYDEFFGFHQFHTLVPQHTYTIAIKSHS